MSIYFRFSNRIGQSFEDCIVYAVNYLSSSIPSYIKICRKDKIVNETKSSDK